jgi:hypothetical protein
MNYSIHVFSGNDEKEGVVPKHTFPGGEHSWTRNVKISNFTSFVTSKKPTTKLSFAACRSVKTPISLTLEFSPTSRVNKQTTQFIPMQYKIGPWGSVVVEALHY